MPQVGGGAALEIEPDEDEDILDPAEGQQPEPEAPETPDDEDAPVSVEDRARAMGWHPLGEYRGDPKKWKPAAEFIKWGESIDAITRDQNRRMAERLARQEPLIAEIPELRNTIAEMKAVMEDMRRLAKTADERGYQRALTELKEKRRDAVAAGDTDTFETVEAQIGEMEKARSEVAREPAPRTEAKPAVPPEITAFAAANPWWNKDPILTQTMVDMHTLVMRKFPVMGLGAQLDEALKRVKAEFPDSFDPDNPEEDDMPTPTARPAARAPTVARPSPAPAPAPRRGASGFDRIVDPVERAQAKTAFDRAKRQMPDLTEAEYLAVYEDPHADVLAIRRQQRKA